MTSPAPSKRSGTLPRASLARPNPGGEISAQKSPQKSCWRAPSPELLPVSGNTPGTAARGRRRGAPPGGGGRGRTERHGHEHTPTEHQQTLAAGPRAPPRDDGRRSPASGRQEWPQSVAARPLRQPREAGRQRRQARRGQLVVAVTAPLDLASYRGLARSSSSLRARRRGVMCGVAMSFAAASHLYGGRHPHRARARDGGRARHRRRGLR
jgi:hypothetical protein